MIEEPPGEDEVKTVADVNTEYDPTSRPSKLCTSWAEMWYGGFDMPFLRSACLRNGIEWTFDDVAYADMMEAVQRFDTNDVHDLVGVYDVLIGGESCGPFDGSGATVTAFENGNWLPLLKHNLADIEQTRELAELTDRFVPRSDFSMKNPTPPTQ